jgi:predicted GTPase
MKNSNKEKIAILTMGLPGAGKSYVVNKNFNTSEFTVIDPDAIKEEKEDYNPKQPAIYHEVSVPLRG